MTNTTNKQLLVIRPTNAGSDIHNSQSHTFMEWSIHSWETIAYLLTFNVYVIFNLMKCRRLLQGPAASGTTFGFRPGKTFINVGSRQSSVFGCSFRNGTNVLSSSCSAHHIPLLLHLHFDLCHVLIILQPDGVLSKGLRHECNS